MDSLPETTLLEPRWIIPVDPPGQVLEQHSVVLKGSVIDSILPSREALATHPRAPRVDLPTHALIPGLVNLHTHAAMTLLRGLADDLPLMAWLKDHIWPAEAQHVAPEFVYDGSLLACAEMLRGGVTCFNDMYFFPEETARAAHEAGMRGCVGIICVDFPTSYAADADDYLQKGLTARDQWTGEPLLSFCMAPHAPYTVGDATFRKILTYAEELDVPVTVHLHETRDEIEESLKRFGVRPIERLHRLGLLSPSLIAVHAVHLTEAEIVLLSETGCHVAHCPSSNLKLGSGIAPVARMLERGVTLGLGTDGSASNNQLDLMGEMRLAALLAKGASGRPEVLPAAQVLCAATLASARALGLDHLIGSITPGKRADLTAVNLGGLDMSPCYDPISHLVYAAGRKDVSHVWVDGRPRLRDRQLLDMDTVELHRKAHFWQQRIARTSGESQ